MMMSKAVKVILALGMVLGLSTIAYASVSTQILLPLVINNDKLYESTPTSAEIPDIIINYIETGGEYMPGKYWEEYVRVKNRTDEKIELTGWTIKSKRTGKILAPIRLLKFGLDPVLIQIQTYFGDKRAKCGKKAAIVPGWVMITIDLCNGTAIQVKIVFGRGRLIRDGLAVKEVKRNTSNSSDDSTNQICA